MCSIRKSNALVCEFKISHLFYICVTKRYVEEDLKKGLGKEPAKVLSARPMDDPLEIIMYLTRLVYTYFCILLFWIVMRCHKMHETHTN